MTQNKLIALGQFLFRFRSFTPLPLLLICLAFFKPLTVPPWLLPLGLIVSAAGEMLRIVAVGWSQGGTSGRESYLRADSLNTRGIYSITRNPLYIGNMMIFFGLTLLFGNVWVTLIMVLFLMLQYQLIVAAEETYLLDKYGARYGQYRQKVPRFLPAIRGYSRPDHPFSWKKVLFKENDSVFNMGVVAWGIFVYRVYLVDGSLPRAPLPWLFLACWIGLYALVKWFKKRPASRS